MDDLSLDLGTIAAQLAASATPAHKDCRVCGRKYSKSRWATLRFVGESDGLEYRDCRCGSTLAVELPEASALKQALAAANVSAANPMDKGAQLNAQLAFLDALLAKAGVAS